MNGAKIGRIHSVQTLGTVDGPGVRFVAFLAGCPLRCACCHNPDTWDGATGTLTEVDELVKTVCRYREYFGQDGGITLSGGEPLCQADFVANVFQKCHEHGIHTCLDTAGCFWNDNVQEALSHCDRVLLDVKYTEDTLYRRYVGMSLETALTFLDHLNKRQIPTTLRQVVIPTINDTAENFTALRKIAVSHRCVDGVELLPFRKVCTVKYDNLHLPFPFADIPEANGAVVRETERSINEFITEKNSR